MENKITKPDDLMGMKVTVLGAARSGTAVAQLLKNVGAFVFVSDHASREKLASQISVLENAGIEYEIGQHTSRVHEADLIIISPGISVEVPILREAERRGLRIVSELEVASWFCPAAMIAITGTNGKTTAVKLLARMFHDAKRKHLVAGNIGTAFSSVVGELDESSIAILEVSSFQLDHIETFHPAISIILNITPDHLDWYEHDFEKYIASKCHIFQNQLRDDILIYNHDDIETREHVRRLASLHVHTLPFGINRQFEEGAFIENGMLVTVLGERHSEIIETDSISIPGIHNQYNSMATTLAAQVMGVAIPSLRATLKNFSGVEHRLEFVRECKRIRYVNDSKATNVDAVWYALQAFSGPLIVLIGGRDKGNDYSKLHEVVAKRVKAVVAIGESADRVYQEFCSITKVVKAGSMDEAVRRATNLASPGDIVLLSPACASFDWFENYEHRGDVFKTIVNAL